MDSMQRENIYLDRQNTEPKYFGRLFVAFISSWIVVVFYNFSFRVLSKLEFETAIAIVVVSFIASMLSAAVSAFVFRRQLLLILFSQLLSMTIVALVAEL
jgi:hypothetical protein